MVGYTVAPPMSGDDTEALPAIRRTVSKSVGYHPDAEMNAIGLAVGAGLLVILIPLAPFLLAVWLVSKLLDLGGRQAT